MDIETLLEQNIDLTYRKFNENIIPGAKNMLGVRMPILRKIAKEIAKGDFHPFLSDPTIDSYEKLMLKGLVIGYAKWESLDHFFDAVEAFVPLIDNWAVCDCFCSGLKTTNKDPERMLALMERYIAREKEYEVRFAVIMLMDYYLTDSYINRTLEVLTSIKCNDYYVMMGLAWALSVAFIKFPELTKPILESQTLDKITHGKTIQKIVESYRVSNSDKTFVKSLR